MLVEEMSLGLTIRGDLVSLFPDSASSIPETTVRTARSAFPKGSLAIRIHDELGPLFDDEQFSTLFPRRGAPAWSPWRLAIVSVLQFAENLSDRQAAEAVRGRIDWKYALALDLDDPGFDFSVLSEFRGRLLRGDPDLVLDLLLDRLRQVGLVKVGGRLRTDSTHVLAAIRTTNRLELVGEAVRAALNALAHAAPAWLSERMRPDWAERYGHRVEEYRLPKDDAERLAFALTVGDDGVVVLHAIDDADTPAWLAELPAVKTLRRIWQQHYATGPDGALRWREAKELPCSAERDASPYDPDARYGVKRSAGWTGFKAHLTEVCDPDAPHLIVQVATTAAQVADSDMTEAIHQRLAARNLLPAVHLIDPGYTSAELLVASRADYGVELLGPARQDDSWQARAGEGFDIGGFDIDWEARTVTCPQGKTSTNWAPWRAKNGESAIHVDFSRKDCGPCPVRVSCTHARREPRQLTLHQHAVHDALQQARRAQQTDQWREQYAARAGVEGTISQAVRGFGLRRCRYRGTAKTHLQHVLVATAINLVRVDAWLSGIPLARTRDSILTKIERAAIV
jgi:transposase